VFQIIGDLYGDPVHDDKCARLQHTIALIATKNSHIFQAAA
jgi:hypothetical protein